MGINHNSTQVFRITITFALSLFGNHFLPTTPTLDSPLKMLQNTSLSRAWQFQPPAVDNFLNLRKYFLPWHFGIIYRLSAAEDEEIEK